MTKIFEEGQDTKQRTCKIVPRNVGQVARTSIQESKLIFGFIDEETKVRHYDFTVRELNGYDEDLLESKKAFVDIMQDVCCNVVTKLGILTDKDKIKDVIINQLSHVDRLKIIYHVRMITLGNLFEFKAICYNQVANTEKKSNGKGGFCLHITKQVGDLSDVSFSKKEEEDFKDYVSKEIDGHKYVIGRITCKKEQIVAPLVMEGDTKTARIASHLYQIDDKEVTKLDQTRELSVKVRNEIIKLIEEELDEGQVDDIFKFRCPECQQQVERELELDKDFFCPVE